MKEVPQQEKKAKNNQDSWSARKKKTKKLFWRRKNKQNKKDILRKTYKFNITHALHNY